MSIKITVLGKPQGKARPRFSNKNGTQRTYTPAKTVDYEQQIRTAFLCDADARELAKSFENKPIAISITAHYSIPKAYSKAKAFEALTGISRPQTKPDIDNIAKVVLDARNEIAYNDDKQVVELYIRKCYTDTDPRIEIEIREVT